MLYSIIALVLRLFLALRLWKTGRLALSAQTRTGSNVVELACAVSLLFGFYVYVSTLILLVYVGIRMWTNYKSGVRLGRDPLLFLLTLILFLQGPGGMSLDKLIGNI